jgi:hypothetical protein
MTRSKGNPQTHIVRAWLNKMRPAEGGKKIVERRFVCEVRHGETQIGLVTVRVKQIVIADGGIEHISRCDARRILIVILRAGCWDGD